MEYKVQILSIIVALVCLLAVWSIWRNRKSRKSFNYYKQDPVITENFGESHDNVSEYVGSPQIISRVDEEEPVQVAPTKPQQIFVLRVLARNGELYSGYELLQTLLANGLRFGDMNIFHRHENINGRGSILFSLASATEPGTFELSKMGGYSSRGLTLFMDASRTDNPSEALEAMLDTARALVDDLGGEIYDEKNQILSQNKIQDWRYQIKQSQQTQHMGDLFEANA